MKAELFLRTNQRPPEGLNVNWGMLRFLAFLLVSVPTLALAQTHEIDDHNLFMEGTVSDADVSANTYFNAMANVLVEWSVLEADLPDGWDFSFCFPDCHPIGVESGTNVFDADSEHYLNCHVYPNNISGTGQLSMLLTTNSAAVDTVTWWVTIEEVNHISSMGDQPIQTFPNPFVSVLNVQGAPKGSSIEWYNAQGKLVKRMPNVTSAEVQVTGLEPGALTMLIKLNNQIIDIRRVLGL